MVEFGVQVNRERLLANLWPVDPSPSRRTWVLLDAARDIRIYRAIQRSYGLNCCLFAGELSPALKEVSPYLVQLDPDEQLTKFVLDNGWGQAWGVFLRSSASLEQLRRHFRTFLRVSDEAGRRLLFRYYDPRVLGVYLPTCYQDELTTIFGPVDRFMVEGEEGTRMNQYRFVGWKLTCDQTDLKSGG